MHATRGRATIRNASAPRFWGRLQRKRSLPHHCRLVHNATDNSTQHGFLNNHRSIKLLGGVGLACGLVHVSATPTSKLPCEAAVATDTSTLPNPLWPSGISESDVETLINDILNDPSMSITGIPDYLERQIYRSTILLTLNTVYQSLASIHGSDLLGHVVVVQREAAPAHLSLQPLRMDGTLLEQLADRLLANQAINQTLIPDVIEKQLYVNCLQLVFSILHILAASVRMTLCGHDVTLHVESSTLEDNAQRVVSSLTTISVQALEDYARQAGVNQQSACGTWWESLRTTHNLCSHMHASLYALILGILDEFFAKTEIRLLSDTIRFDIVPGKGGAMPCERTTMTTPTSDSPVVSAAASSSRTAATTFALGVAAGATLASWIASSHR